MVQWLGLLYRLVLEPCLRLAPGGQHSRLTVPAPPALRLRWGLPLELLEVGERPLAHLIMPT